MRQITLYINHQGIGELGGDPALCDLSLLTAAKGSSKNTWSHSASKSMQSAWSVYPRRICVVGWASGMDTLQLLLCPCYTFLDYSHWQPVSISGPVHGIWINLELLMSSSAPAGKVTGDINPQKHRHHLEIYSAEVKGLLHLVSLCWIKYWDPSL